MPFIPFLVAPNLVGEELREAYPWDFIVPEADNWPKKLAKPARRKALLQKDALWNCYTAVRGFAPNLLISKTNPPAALRGIVVDYDMVTDIDTICGHINQTPEQLHPNFVEITLSGNVRLVWVFEREILTPSSEFCNELISHFSDKLGAPSLLAGYDPVGSLKPTERWSNGGTWYTLKETPLPWVYCFGVVCDVSKKSKLFGKAEIPLEVIEAEVQRRFPGRWSGEFRLDAVGIRFWDEKADNPTGCQIKPDGMLCFTGDTGFVKWETLFGRQWCEEQKLLNLGKAGENIFFDGKVYWEKQSVRWVSVARPDIMLRLKGRGLSDTCAKGETQSDVERVLDYTQQINRVEGAAPFVNYKPGLLEVGGLRFLNVANLAVTQPIAGLTGNPEIDFGFIKHLLKGFFARPENFPLDHFLTWLKFSHLAFLNNERRVGQALFFCGPRNNGKTLVANHIIVPMCGTRTANPMNFLTGQTEFNDELFHAGVLTINDEDAPRNEGERNKMLARLKSFVVNPTHTYHPKFCSRVSIHWTGRVIVTLNDDPGSTAILPDVGFNTEDKMMFFASQAYDGVWPDQKTIEAKVAAQLPAFAYWLDNHYNPPASVLSSSYRGGVVSYYDPVILELSRQQLYSYNLEELLRAWFTVAPYWLDQGNETWVGSPTQLFIELGSYDPLKPIMREWTQPRIAKAMTGLAKQKTGGVEFMLGSYRDFTITKANL